MKPHIILRFLSLLLLLLLLANTLLQFDFGATKRRGEINQYKMETKAIQHPDSLQQRVNFALDQMEILHKENSDSAFRSFILILALLVVQILLWVMRQTAVPRKA